LSFASLHTTVQTIMLVNVACVYMHASAYVNIRQYMSA
jgi:hypothetical protein